jgi:hypothetical protein
MGFIFAAIVLGIPVALLGVSVATTTGSTQVTLLKSQAALFGVQLLCLVVGLYQTLG